MPEDTAPPRRLDPRSARGAPLDPPAPASAARIARMRAAGVGIALVPGARRTGAGAAAACPADMLDAGTIFREGAAALAPAAGLKATRGTGAPMGMET
jgi:hypothetical protein